MTSTAELLQAATRMLGPCELTAVITGAVIKVTTPAGSELVIKQHPDRRRFEHEVHAYQHWTAALGRAAPELAASDESALTTAVSALAGHSPGPADLTPGTFRQAGTLLRRFHEAGPQVRLPWFRDWLWERAAYWAGRAAPLLMPDDAAAVNDHLTALGDIGSPLGGPCHLDFQPRNWLITRSGKVALIDFEHARTDLPARDFVRLRFRTWPGQPRLKGAFLTGYGQILTQSEERAIWHLGALDALTSLARGHEDDDPELIAIGRNTLGQLREHA